ncbi:hypothetical protein [Azotobacter chroococcum]|uniref:hypothetical protein n=1 Tax=Azotobacter chroococcum TaxID=353 RepID=UPI0013967F12|nr:hypothetical protein [Azotobacter chroococcum]
MEISRGSRAFSIISGFVEWAGSWLGWMAEAIHPGGKSLREFSTLQPLAARST